MRVDGGLAGRRPRRLFDAETPARLRLLGVAAGALVVVWATALVVETQLARTGLTVIGERRAPVVTAASDLYFALNDMDAQLANVLLVGDQTQLGVTRSQALTIFETRRAQGDADLQTVAAAASDPLSARQVRALLDDLGSYEALAAGVLLLQPEDASAAVAKYRSATDLLRLTLLPGARRLVDREAQTLTARYDDERARARDVLLCTVVFGFVLLALLLAGQFYLSRRFRRLVNPALAGASLIVAGLLGVGVVVAHGHEHRLQVAKLDAFDSVMVLQEARAVSYDANADESRFLLDPARQDQYQQAFLTKTQQVFGLDGATLSTFDQRFAAGWDAYRRDHQEVGWSGYLGSEFRNITFAGERAAAEQVVASYQIYQADDRQIRRLASTGQRRAAIALCTSYAPGGSNFAFDRYDAALSALIGINQQAFRTAVRDDQRQLALWQFVPAGAALGVLVLLFCGLRPRLAEYR